MNYEMVHSCAFGAVNVVVDFSDTDTSCNLPQVVVIGQCSAIDGSLD